MACLRVNELPTRSHPLRCNVAPYGPELIESINVARPDAPRRGRVICPANCFADRFPVRLKQTVKQTQSRFRARSLRLMISLMAQVDLTRPVAESPM